VRTHPAPAPRFSPCAADACAHTAAFFPHPIDRLAGTLKANADVFARSRAGDYLAPLSVAIMTSDDDVDRAVLAYLEAHPSAGDTLEGITAWWLEQRRIRYGVEIVSGALERLIIAGSVERLRRRDETAPLFRLTMSHDCSS
jgi:hypothetical protein